MNRLDKFLNKLSTLVVEKDGTLSHRKIIALIFVIFTGWMIYATQINNNGDLYSDIAWVSVVGGALGISYIRQISSFKHGSNEGSKNSSNSRDSIPD